jgi:hypothetical protein
MQYLTSGAGRRLFRMGADIDEGPDEVVLVRIGDRAKVSASIHRVGVSLAPCDATRDSDGLIPMSGAFEINRTSQSFKRLTGCHDRSQNENPLDGRKRDHKLFSVA